MLSTQIFSRPSRWVSGARNNKGERVLTSQVLRPRSPPRTLWFELSLAPCSPAKWKNRSRAERKNSEERCVERSCAVTYLSWPCNELKKEECQWALQKSNACRSPTDETTYSSALPVFRNAANKKNRHLRIGWVEDSCCDVHCTCFNRPEKSRMSLAEYGAVDSRDVMVSSVAVRNDIFSCSSKQRTNATLKKNAYCFLHCAVR